MNKQLVHSYVEDMPGSATRIILANKVFNRYFPVKDRRLLNVLSESINQTTAPVKRNALSGNHKSTYIRP